MDRRSWMWYLQQDRFLLFHLEALCYQVLPGNVKELETLHTQHSSNLLTQPSITNPNDALDLPMTTCDNMLIKHCSSYS